MIIVQPRQDLPVIPTRGPHFFKIADMHFKETDHGEVVLSLPLQVWLDAMISNSADPETVEALHDIGANAGLRMNMTKFCHPKEEQTVANLLERATDICLRKDGQGKEFIEVPLDHMAALIIIHHGNNDLKRKKAVMEFLSIIGVEPNEARIFADFCPECGRKANVSR